MDQPTFLFLLLGLYVVLYIPNPQKAILIFDLKANFTCNIMPAIGIRDRAKLHAMPLHTARTEPLANSLHFSKSERLRQMKKKSQNCGTSYDTNKMQTVFG